MPRDNLNILTDAESEAGGEHDQEWKRRAEHVEDAYSASAQHRDVVDEKSVDTLEVCQPPDSHPSHGVRYTYNTVSTSQEKFPILLTNVVCNIH